MKKIFYLVLLTFCFISCYPTSEEEVHVISENIFPWSSVIEFEYKGHKYIKFDDGYQAGVVHNPECPCMKK